MARPRRDPPERRLEKQLQRVEKALERGDYASACPPVVERHLIKEFEDKRSRLEKLDERCEAYFRGEISPSNMSNDNLNKTNWLKWILITMSIIAAASVVVILIILI
jgi:uncharacterized protein YqcC (DUF446 family)